MPTGYVTKSKQEIEAVHSELDDIIQQDGFFDHLVRAVEIKLSKHKKDHPRDLSVNRETGIYRRRRKASDLARLRDKDSDNQYRIFKIKTNSRSKRTAYIHMGDKYATLFYNPGEISDYADEARWRIAARYLIAHELGHAGLHYRLDADGKVLQVVAKNQAEFEQLDTEAAYFAEFAAKRRAAQHRQDALTEKDSPSDVVIDEVIEGIENGHIETHPGAISNFTVQAPYAERKARLT